MYNIKVLKYKDIRSMKLPSLKRVIASPKGYICSIVDFRCYLSQQLVQRKQKSTMYIEIYSKDWETSKNRIGNRGLLHPGKFIKTTTYNNDDNDIYIHENCNIKYKLDYTDVDKTTKQIIFIGNDFCVYVSSLFNNVTNNPNSNNFLSSNEGFNECNFTKQPEQPEQQQQPEVKTKKRKRSPSSPSPPVVPKNAITRFLTKTQSIEDMFKEDRKYTLMNEPPLKKRRKTSVSTKKEKCIDFIFDFDPDELIKF